MTTKANRPSPVVQNPRYKGATPEEVARALLRKWGGSPADNESDPGPDSKDEPEAA